MNRSAGPRGKSRCGPPVCPCNAVRSVRGRSLVSDYWCVELCCCCYTQCVLYPGGDSDFSPRVASKLGRAVRARDTRTARRLLCPSTRACCRSVRPPPDRVPRGGGVYCAVRHGTARHGSQTGKSQPSRRIVWRARHRGHRPQAHFGARTRRPDVGSGSRPRVDPRSSSSSSAAILLHLLSRSTSTLLA